MVSLILTDSNVTQPDTDTDEEESFSLARCLLALADTYPGHFQTALQEWQPKHVVGDARHESQHPKEDTEIQEPSRSPLGSRGIKGDSPTLVKGKRTKKQKKQDSWGYG